MISQEERVYPNTFTVAPVAVLDLPMNGKGFMKYDEDGNEIGLMTINEKIATSGARRQLSKDKNYFMFGWELSRSDIKKGEAEVARLQALGWPVYVEDEEDEATYMIEGQGAVWFLTGGQRDKFLAVNPMFQVVDEVV